MKKGLAIYVFVAAIICAGCHTVGSFDGSAPDVSKPVEAGADTSKGYQPATANSFIKYAVTTNGTTTDTLTNTMLGTNSTINGRLYHVVSQNSRSTGSVISYLSNINHAYSVRDYTSVKGLATDILYLIDNVPVGSTWTSQFTDNGTLSGDPAQIVGAVAEKDIKKTIAGKVFSNVIHTTIQLQHNIGLGFVTYGTYDFYIAKGIGIIELDAALGFSDTVIIHTNEVLADYSIK